MAPERMTPGYMTKPAATVERLLSWVSDILLVIGGVAVVLMLVHVTLDVLLKYFANMPINGTLEIVSLYYMVAVVFLPLAAVQRARGHIIIEVFSQKLGPRVVAALDGASGLLGVAFLTALTVMSGIEAVQRTATLERWDVVFFYLPVWPTRWFVPIGCGAFTLYLALHSIADLTYALRGRNRPPGQAEPDAPPRRRGNP